jgi:hypothetical protein
MHEPPHLAAAALLLALAGCQLHTTPGRRVSAPEYPIVTVEAGDVPVAGGRYFARYLVDRTTQSCWFVIADSVAPLACCNARRVSALRDVITWENDESCAPAGSPH